MVIWKERQHDNDDTHVTADASSITSLWGSGLLKFFHAPIMVSHVQLLEHILQMWNPEQQHFEVGPHILTVEVEDIYFLIRLSRHEAHISLTGSQVGDITTQEVIVYHYYLGTNMLGKKISIKDVMDLAL